MIIIVVKYFVCFVKTNKVIKENVRRTPKIEQNKRMSFPNLYALDTIRVEVNFVFQNLV